MSIVNFNPEQSAELLKSKLQSFNKMTVEIVEELFKAREYYSNSGFRTDLRSDVRRLDTFEKYLSESGINDRTARRWLERYVPEQNKLLSFEEFQEKKQVQEIKKQSAEEQFRSILMTYRKTGKKIEGWTDKHENLIVQEEKNRARDAVKAAEALAQWKKEAEEHNRKKAEEDLFSRTIDEAVKNFSEKVTERKTWKDKIRLSDSGKDDAFNDAILDYLETLTDDNRRIEACNNIIKICRNISVELQRSNL